MRIFLATALRDEAPFLIEWLAWQRLLGVTDIAVFSNDCRDGSDDLLDVLASHGILRHIRNLAPAGKSIQWNALKEAWALPERKAADWMVFIDVDEFPIIHTGDHRYADLIAALPKDCDAVTMAWRLFGHNGRIWEEDLPVIERFTKCAPPDLAHPIAATYFKSFFRPSAFQKAGVHRPAHRRGTQPIWCDGSGQTLNGFIAESDKRLSLWPHVGQRDLVELHHYSLRSLENFIVKSERGLPNRTSKQIDLKYWVARNFNSQDNFAALALKDVLKAEIAMLQSLSGVAELQARAIVWHRAQARRLLEQAEYYDLFAHCHHAQNSTPLDQATAGKLYQLFQHTLK